MLVAASYATVVGTTALSESFNSKLVAVKEPAAISSLNFTVDAAPTLMPAAPGAGVRAVIVGASVSGVMLRSMSFWISAALRARL